jgi:hypothetical protein
LEKLQDVRARLIEINEQIELGKNKMDFNDLEYAMGTLCVADFGVNYLQKLILWYNLLKK